MNETRIGNRAAVEVLIARAEWRAELSPRNAAKYLKVAASLRLKIRRMPDEITVHYYRFPSHRVRTSLGY